MAHGEQLKVLLLGDSISYMGGKQSYIYYALTKLQQKLKFHFEIANMSISGLSVRDAEIIFPRALNVMPEPDLTTFFLALMMLNH